jgi:hypothetical protein
MPFITLLLSLVSLSSFAAPMDKEFRCYTEMNKSTRAENVLIAGRFAVHPIDVYSFYLVSGSSVQKCRVPAQADLGTGGKEGAGPWLLKLEKNKKIHRFQYPHVKEDPLVKGSPQWRSPECTSVTDRDIWAKLLENRIADSRQNCGEGPQLPDCLSDFLARLSACEGIPSVKDYVMEIGRSARVHARPAPTKTEEKTDINR